MSSTYRVTPIMDTYFALSKERYRVQNKPHVD